MRNLLSLAVGVSVLAFALPASATTIDFGDLATGRTASGTLTYADATFTSGSGSFYIGAAGGDHALCAITGYSCANAVTIDFAAPISSLTFLASGDDSAASSIFVSGTTVDGSFDFTGGGFDGDVHTASLIDLSAYAGITSLTITSNDRKGLGYDVFSFQPFIDAGSGTGATVPEPASWALMLSGLALVGGAMRRRNRSMVAA